MRILLYFLPGIILLGAITSFEDITDGKIRNKWVVLALLYACCAYLLLAITAAQQPGSVVLQSIGQVVLALLMGVVLWVFGVWTPADAKLYIAFSALLPPALISGLRPWWTGFDLLVNIFMPALAFVLILAGIRISRMRAARRHARTALMEIADPRAAGIAAVRLFAVMWLVQLAFTALGLPDRFPLQLVLVLVIAHWLWRESFTYVAAGIAVLRLIFDHSVYSIGFCIGFVALLALLRVIQSIQRGGIRTIINEVFSTETPVRALRHGMVLVSATGRVRRHCKSGELTDRDISRMVKSGVKRVRVATTMPFAPFIFLGALLTLSLRANILIVLSTLA